MHTVVETIVVGDRTPPRQQQKRKKGDNQQTFLMAKWSMLRLLGLVYFVTFLGASYQNPGLIGSRGLAPASEHMDRLRKSVSRETRLAFFRKEARGIDGFMSHPTLFWWINNDGRVTDEILQAVYTAGLVIAFAVTFLGIDSWLAMLVLWILDFSVVTVAGGSSFYQYGWESQLLETGFLSIFLCDFPYISKGKDGNWKLRGVFRDNPVDNEHFSHPSCVALWLMRWLSFRISIGAGLIKMRSGSCWEKKTCLHYHFETQPMPSPMSFFFHFLPKIVLSLAVDLDLFVQLYSSWLVLVPGVNGLFRAARNVGGLVQAAFMVNIILSGNFAFLNHLTIVPALACLDDTCWPLWLRDLILGKVNRTDKIVDSDEREIVPAYRLAAAVYVRWSIDLMLLCLIAMLSLPVVENLLQWNGGRQQMNASFDAFRLVNTYGAFGSVGEARYEAIVSVSLDGKTWNELDFPCKPGNTTRRPCFSAPYHYRLDWNVWFLGFKPHTSMLRNREGWLFVLLAKLLDPDEFKMLHGGQPQLDGRSNETPTWLGLLDSTAARYFPPQAREQPRFAKVDMYRYQMSAPLWDIVLRWANGRSPIIWWTRRYEETLIPRVLLDQATKKLKLA